MNFFRWKQRQDEELDAEIRHHLDEAIRVWIARGECLERIRQCGASRLIDGEA